MRVLIEYIRTIHFRSVAFSVGLLFILIGLITLYDANYFQTLKRCFFSSKKNKLSSQPIKFINFNSIIQLKELMIVICCYTQVELNNELNQLNSQDDFIR